MLLFSVHSPADNVALRSKTGVDFFPTAILQWYFFSLRLLHLAELALFHLVDDRKARVSRARARKGMEQVIGNIRFFTIGMCCLAAAIWNQN